MQEILVKVSSDSTIESAKSELTELGIENLFTIEEANQTLIGGVLHGKMTPLIHSTPIKKDLTIDWEKQWKEFSPCYDNGLAHIHLKEYRGPDITFSLKPGPGFGDLSHITTKQMIQLMVTHRKYHTVVDIGTGSGILAIVAHYLGAEKIYALEIEKHAAAHAKKNFDFNSIKISSSLPNKFQSPPLFLMNMTLAEQQIALNQYAKFFQHQSVMIVAGLLKNQVDDYLSLLSKSPETTIILDNDPWIAMVIRF